MRYKFDTFAPSGKRQYTFSVGVRDLEILYGILLYSRVPNIKGTEGINQRIKSMIKTLREALNEAEEYGDDGGRKRVATKITGNTADTIIIDEARINPTTSRVTENGLVNDELSENEA